MKLYCQYSYGANDLVKFVNENNIQKENIQEIIRVGENIYCVFYWE